MELIYTNPVWSGYLADPFVMKWRGVYYATGTGSAETEGMQPDGLVFPLLRSPDLTQWEHLGGALTPVGDPNRPAHWAPEIAERDGVFYLYYSSGGTQGEGQKLRVALSDQPEGPYEDSGADILPDEPFSIDPHPFRDPKDGRWYLFFAKDFFDGRAGTGTAVVPLDDNMLPAGPVTTVIRAQHDWQIFERDRFWYGQIWRAWHTVEGPFVLAHEGSYYCLYSGGRWEIAAYGVGFGVAESVTGPYIDDQDADGPAVLAQRTGVLGPGHCSVVLGPDDRTPFVVYHAWNAEGTKRQMRIDPLRWTPTGPRCDGPSVGTRKIVLP